MRRVHFVGLKWIGELRYITMRRLLLAIFLFAISADVRAQTQPADMTIADFENAQMQLAATGGTPSIASNGAAAGERYLNFQISVQPPDRAVFWIPVPDGNDFPRHERLTFQLRSPKSNGLINLRWLARDQEGTTLFQRRFQLAPGERWVQLDEPIRNWRWDDQHVGSWSEVKQLALRVESPTGEIDLDDIRLTGEGSSEDRTTRLLQLAFEARRIRRVEMEGMLVATDAVDGFADADLRARVRDMLHARDWIRRVFGDSVHPADDGQSIMLLIFAKESDRNMFFQRLADLWRAKIDPPTAQGFTLQDISAATYQQELGVNRPVYLHEAVHAIVARELRLQGGFALHSAMQEGLANYLQLCLHPQSLPQGTYAQFFARPIDPSGTGFFKPLKTLFSRQVSSSEYAQLASVIGYLVEQNPALLRKLARDLAAGLPAEHALTETGLTWADLEQKWLSWGKGRFCPPADPGQPPFSPPVEFR